MAPPSPTGQALSIGCPKTPLDITSLTTNASHEPSLLQELESKIASADDVEVLVAFIRVSGIHQNDSASIVEKASSVAFYSVNCPDAE